MTINVFAGAVVFAILVIIWIGMMSVASLVEYLISRRWAAIFRGLGRIVRYGFARLGGADQQEAHRLVLQK